MWSQWYLGPASGIMEKYNAVSVVQKQQDAYKNAATIKLCGIFLWQLLFMVQSCDERFPV